MEMIRKNFKKALSLLCAVAMIASTLVVMSVSASAATISGNENVFTSLEAEVSLTLTFDAASYGYLLIPIGSGRGGLGLASGTNNADEATFLRPEGVDGTGAVKWTTSNGKNLIESGIIVGEANTVDPENYVLEPNKKYTVSFDYKDNFTDASGVELAIVGAAPIYNDSNVITGYDTANGTEYYVLSTKGVYNTAFTTFTTTFTTGAELGSNVNLAFVMRNPLSATSGASLLDNVTVTTYKTLDPKDLITFKDNGKTYYAYPDVLTALPDGDNGTLGSEFIGWFDAEGNEVTEVPAAGTVLNAKYPLVTELPDKVESVYLSLFNTQNRTLASNSTAGTLGLVSVSSASHDIYARNTTVLDGTTQWVVKFAYASKNASDQLENRSMCFGKANVAGNGASHAYILEPDTKYTVSYNVYHEKGANISFNLAASSSTNATTGLVLDSNKPSSIIKSWTTYTREFTTPDAQTLGDQKYLLFVVNNPDLIQNISWIYGVTITKTTAGDPADYITFVDGDNVYYTSAGDISELPKGQLADGENEFLGWYDGNGNRVTEVPTESGTVLTSKYGTIDSGLVAISIRREKGTGAEYQSAGIRFKGRLSNDIVEKASEVGFILVPEGTSIDSDRAIKAVNKSADRHIIYEAAYDGYTDYQVILTGLTRENSTKNLCQLKIEVYFYYIIDGERQFEGEPCVKSYDEVVAIMEADLPVVNNTLSEITSAGTGPSATDKITGETLTLTPPSFETVIGAATYADGADNTTLMTVTNTSRSEYEAYLASLEEMGYTAIVGNSRILSSSQNFSAIYSDGTNIIDVAYFDFEKSVKVNIQPVGYDNLEDINDYFKMFHAASANASENYVCDPLFLTIGTTGSENNTYDDYTKDMGYMYRLYDGSFIIIDGGSSNSSTDYKIAQKIYSMLKYYSPDKENIRIAQWVMTHAHGDHISVFREFEPTYLADSSYNVTLESIVVNLPNENWISNGSMPETTLGGYRNRIANCKARGTKVYKAHAGHVYYLPGYSNEMLYSLEQTIPTTTTMSNTTSLVFQIEMEEKTFMYTADATSISINYVNAAYGKKLKSDFVQIPHHGTVSNFAASTFEELQKFYTDYTQPSYTLWPTSEAGFAYYVTRTLESNPNVVVKDMMGYDKMIALGHNIKEMKLNTETLDYKVLEYYEIGFVKQESVAVSTEEEFKAIGENPRGYYHLTNNITITEAVTNSYWGSSFSGLLDGNGYTVTFANPINTVGNYSHSGVLCNNIGGVLKNISFGTAEAPIQINYSQTTAGAWGFFGTTKENVTFDTVKLYADIIHTPDGGMGTYLGGFLGRVHYSAGGTGGFARFKNSEFNGTYTETAVAGNIKAFGGFVGGITEKSRVYVEGCSVNATIVGKNAYSTTGVGGVIGRVVKVFEVNISDTTVNGTIQSGSYVGGLVGNVSPADGVVKLTDNIIKATVTGTKENDYCGLPGTITTISNGWRTHPEDYKLIALTFDDAPTYATTTNNNTIKIIKTLNKYEGAGTLFCVGTSIEKNGTALLKYALNSNFELANHSYNHVNLDELTREEMVSEIDDTTKLMEETLGVTPKFYRPANGKIDATGFEVAAELGLPVIWSDTAGVADYNSETTAEFVEDKVVNGVRDGSIVLLHSWPNCTTTALDNICKRLYDQGYRFVTVSELFELKGVDMESLPTDKKINNVLDF